MRSLLRNLAFSSLVLAILSSCSESLYKGSESTGQLTSNDPAEHSWFLNNTGRTLYKCSVDVYGNNFSGLLFIKPIGETHRILFITETGLKIFDMEFSRNKEMKTWYCMEALNRKTITRTLGNDLYLMLYNIADNGTAHTYTKAEDNRVFVRSEDIGGRRYCFFGRSTGKTEELVKRGSLRNKMAISFFGADGPAPDSLKLEHNNIKLTIQLNRIYETGAEISE